MKINKTYKFHNSTWWDDSGCSCCEPTEMVCWNSEEIPHSLHSKQGCYAAALASVSEQLTEERAKQILDSLGVKLEFID